MSANRLFKLLNLYFGEHDLLQEMLENSLCKLQMRKMEEQKEKVTQQISQRASMYLININIEEKLLKEMFQEYKVQ